MHAYFMQAMVTWYQGMGGGLTRPFGKRYRQERRWTDASVDGSEHGPANLKTGWILPIFLHLCASRTTNANKRPPTRPLYRLPLHFSARGADPSAQVQAQSSSCFFFFPPSRRPQINHQPRISHPVRSVGLGSCPNKSNPNPLTPTQRLTRAWTPFSFLPLILSSSSSALHATLVESSCLSTKRGSLSIATSRESCVCAPTKHPKTLAICNTPSNLLPEKLAPCRTGAPPNAPLDSPGRVLRLDGPICDQRDEP